MRRVFLASLRLTRLRRGFLRGRPAAGMGARGPLALGGRLVPRVAAKGLRGHALDALAGDGGVGRERVTVAPGSVAFENNGKMGVPAEVSSVESVRGCGAVDGDRENLLSCVALSAGEARFSGVAAIEAWFSARATVASR